MERLTDNSSDLVGWVLETPGRGTLGLITTCLTTIFFCTWVVIHPRVYKSQLYATLHKFVLFFKTVLAPEFIAVEGFQEWAQCIRMRRDCAKLTKGRFELIHGFYISMLALRYRTPLGDRVIWPNQYTWLLQQHIITWEDHGSWGLSIEDIRDKSKADSVAKLIALTQVTWFVAECIIRAAHSLPLSQLESMTLGYIPLFIATYFFWWDKPKDIRSPSIIELPDMSPEQKHIFESMAISNKFDNEGTEKQMTLWNTWYLTPRVFEKEEEDKLVQDRRAKASERAVQQAAKKGNENQKTNSVSGVPQDTMVSENEIPDAEELRIAVQKEIVLAHWDPHLYRSKIWPLTCLFGVSFGALHLASWNTVFPTTVEMWLWRASAFVSIVSMVIFMHFEKVVLRWDSIFTIISLASVGFYFISRILMMGEVFVALRAEEPAIYSTFAVSNYWIHFL